MGGNWETKGNSGNAYDTDTDAPVKDSDTAEAYYEELEWMNGTIEETVDITINTPVVKCEIEEKNHHLFDFFTTYTLNGNVYYLDSNSVTQTPRSLTQKLRLIRWQK